jgi:hypothetical protein
MKDIEKSWNEFLVKPFPGGQAGIEIEGIELASLDTFAAGCIDTFIHNRGHLDQQQTSILKDCAKEIDVVVTHLDGEAKIYFERLRSLAKQVLHSVK